MKYPNVSVIMATYNGEAFLNDQLNSIYKQSYHTVKLIVSDDGSSDGTPAILAREAELNRLNFVEDYGHLGVIGNFKRAAAYASNDDYIAFADQDDIWDQDKIALSVAAINKIEKVGVPALVYSDLKVIDSRNQTIHESFWDLFGYRGYLHALPTAIFGCMVTGCTMLLNPILAKEIPNIPNDCIMHDAWLALYAFSFGTTAVMEGHPVWYRQHQSNVVFNSEVQTATRLQKLCDQVRKWFLGKDDLFKEQFSFVEQFYAVYEGRMNSLVKAEFMAFLSLKNASYIKKKLAFRSAMKRAANFPQVF